VKSLEARADAMRARLRLRAWETRQLRGAKGTWFRLRITLARAREAFIVDDEVVDELLAEGFGRERVGDELEPTRNYVFVSSERASAIASRRSIAVRLSRDLLAAKNVVLVPFGGEAPT
jgi:hypothetical protein